MEISPLRFWLCRPFILSEYHLRKHVSYFLRPVQRHLQQGRTSYSFTLLHSGASEADMSVE